VEPLAVLHSQLGNSMNGRPRPLGEKVAPLEEANGVWVAPQLLREMAAEGKA
jgi:hypothetical protein